MARTKGSVGATTQKAILDAAKTLIVKHGFEAMTLRQLAAEVGVQPASIYRYIESKDTLLAALMTEHMDTLIHAWEALEDKGETPDEQLEAFVAFHIRYHVERREDVFIANMELRSLGEAARADVVAKRRAYELNLWRILEEGVKTGDFPETDLEVATYAILAMLTGVCFWYRPEGRLTVEQIIEIHQGLVMRGVVSGDFQAV
ncbi:TetR/AcrR family transcriptional regulator [Pseudovibrio exalbescens]|uniref:TetR family transcriptional regulator n=1 Tax=Pseudovibrio exalbescens TaxID=197461 RepID=A0A1U7JHF1_9HYPH|nr:TetR/AcrR family transcriptional regulator [Pseudovibrio exalbescens]OKL44118.1 TetR family transcriptional regulator [Pseudovibrio exalbescens]